MKVLGLDFGNYNTKTSEGVLFKSVVMRGTCVNFRRVDDMNVMEIDNEKVVVGEGDFETDPNKLDKSMFKLCTLKAIALSTNDTSVKIMMGLPSVQYSNVSIEKVRKELLVDKVYKFKLGGVDRTIIIEDIDFFPESAGAYYSLTSEQKVLIKGRDLVLVNIGGGNTNIGFFKLEQNGRKLIKGSTVMSGILHLYADVIDVVNGKFGLNKSIEDGEKYVRSEEIYIYDERKKLDFIKNTVDIHLDRIFKDLNMYPIKDSAVVFTGGGADLYKKELAKRVPNCIFQPHGVMANAIGFKRVGEFKWRREFR